MGTMNEKQDAYLQQVAQKNTRIILRVIPTSHVSVKDKLEYREYTVTTSGGQQLQITIQNDALRKCLSPSRGRKTREYKNLVDIVTACEKRIIQLYKQQHK